MNGRVNAVAVDPAGKIYIGGAFDSIAGRTRNGYARLNADGSLGPSLNCDGMVNAIAVQADGKVLVGGTFTHVGGTSRTRLARIFTTGNLDPSFAPSLNSDVNVIACQADGKIVIGGRFTSVGRSSRRCIARLNSVTGSLSAHLARLHNDTTPFDELTVSAPSRIQWLRGGSAPEAMRVTFDVSIDNGVTFAPLG